MRQQNSERADQCDWFIWTRLRETKYMYTLYLYVEYVQPEDKILDTMVSIRIII